MTPLPSPSPLVQGSTYWSARALWQGGGEGWVGGVGGEGGVDRNGQESWSLFQQSWGWNNPAFRAFSSLVGFPLGFLLQAWPLVLRVSLPWCGRPLSCFFLALHWFVGYGGSAHWPCGTNGLNTSLCNYKSFNKRIWRPLFSCTLPHIGPSFCFKIIPPYWVHYC